MFLFLLFADFGILQDLIFYFRKYMDKSIVYLILLILFCSVKVNTQILISRCKICQRCTYCGDDVLYDCYIDDIYNNFIAKKQIIPQAFPVNISKTVNKTSTTYFFQFSNNKNISYQIIQKNSMTNITLNTTINDSQGNSKWKGLSNASQIILSYAINRLYLSPSSSLVSLTEQANNNTYTAVVKSEDKSIRFTVIINPKDFGVKVINVEFISSLATSVSPNNIKNKTIISKEEIKDNKNEQIGIKIRKGLTINSSIQQLLNYLYINYNSLINFQLDSFSTKDNTFYDLNLSSIIIPTIKYHFQVLILVPVSGNLRGLGTPSSAFQIMSYSLINTTNTNSFKLLDNAQALYSDLYAQKVINKVQTQIFQLLNLKNLRLVNISSSIPFYNLTFQMETQIIQFLVSYDLLTSNIRLIEEQMIDKTKGRAGKAVNLGQGEIKQQNNLSQGPIKELVILNPEKLNQIKVPLVSAQKNIVNPNNLIQVKESNPNQILVPQILPIPQIIPNISTSQQFTFDTTKIKQNKFISNSIINYIDYRNDAVFQKAFIQINSIYKFNRSNIMSISQINLPNIKQYNITLNFNLASRKYLQFIAEYNVITKNITFNNFIYTPKTVIDINLFQSYPLETIGSNSIVMNIIASIFIQYPQYFSSSVSQVWQILAYPPYFNITYNNSAFGMITFSCEYNYLTTNTVVVNISTKNITQSSLLPKPNPQSFTPVEKNTVLPQTSTSINTQLKPVLTKQISTQNTSDMFCINFKNGKCLQCIFRFYYDDAKYRCVAVQDWCYQFDYSKKYCKECFSGYSLVNGNCQLD